MLVLLIPILQKYIFFVLKWLIEGKNQFHQGVQL